jgi:hypothetical protein
MSPFYNFTVSQNCSFELQKNIMKKYIPNFLSAWLFIILTFPVSEKVFSQATQKENKADKSSTYVTGITTGRAKSIVAGVVGLISIVIGWRAKARSAKQGAKVALAFGIIGIVLSVVHLSTSAGAVFGSGSGKAGAIVALLLALIGVTLGMLAFRSRQNQTV